jgi:hypothetical protein
MRLCQICNNAVAQSDTTCRICGGSQFVEDDLPSSDSASAATASNKPFSWIGLVTALCVILFLCGLPVWLPAMLKEYKYERGAAHVVREKGATSNEIMAKEGQPKEINIVKDEHGVTTLEYVYPDHTYVMKRSRKKGIESYRVIDKK